MGTRFSGFSDEDGPDVSHSNEGPSLDLKPRANAAPTTGHVASSSSSGRPQRGRARATASDLESALRKSAEAPARVADDDPLPGWDDGAIQRGTSVSLELDDSRTKPPQHVKPPVRTSGAPSGRTREDLPWMEVPARPQQSSTGIILAIVALLVAVGFIIALFVHARS